MRSGAAVLAAATAAATAFVAVSSSAGAATVNSACDARAVGVNAPDPVSIAAANPASSPCKFDNVALAAANAVVIPGVPLVSEVAAQVRAVQSQTSYAIVGGLASSEAQTDVAKLLVTGPGLYLTASGIHSQAGTVLNSFCGGAGSAESWLASLTVNGKVIPVANKPITINLGLRITINVNQTVRTSPHEVTQRALFITFPDHRYSLVVGEAHAQSSCPS